MAGPEIPPVRTRRPLALSEVPACLVLSREAGWNQTASDWRLILTIGGGTGVFDGARLVATAAVIPHGRDLGWICMVLVAAAARRQGLATELVRWAIDALAAEGRVAGLDATPAGREVYRKLGFTGTAALTRLEAAAPDRISPAEAGIIRPLGADELAAVVRYDEAIFGADRGAILAELYRRHPRLAGVAEKAGRIAGYVLARDGDFATQIGPVVAENERTARELLAHALARTEGPVVIDLADRHEGVGAWLRIHGFSPRRSFTRMLNGGFASGDPSRLFAIAGPELA